MGKLLQDYLKVKNETKNKLIELIEKQKNQKLPIRYGPYKELIVQQNQIYVIDKYMHRIHKADFIDLSYLIQIVENYSEKNRTIINSKSK